MLKEVFNGLKKARRRIEKHIARVITEKKLSDARKEGFDEGYQLCMDGIIEHFEYLDAGDNSLESLMARAMLEYMETNTRHKRKEREADAYGI